MCINGYVYISYGYVYMCIYVNISRVWAVPNSCSKVHIQLRKSFTSSSIPLHYRYPGVGGESYLDVIERVRPIIIELERQRHSIVIVAHLAVLRCIYAYFMGEELNNIPHIDIPMNTIYELTPGPFGCLCTVIKPHRSRHKGIPQYDDKL